MSEDLHQLAGAYALDALSDEEREQFEAHLSDCDDCQAEVAGFRDTAAMLGAGAAEPAPEGMRARLLDAIEHTPQEPAPLGAHPRGALLRAPDGPHLAEPADAPAASGARRAGVARRRA